MILNRTARIIFNAINIEKISERDLPLVKEAAVLEPGNPYIQERIMQVAYSLRKYKESISAFEALFLNEKTPDALLQRALPSAYQLYKRTKNTQKISLCLETMASLQPDRWDIQQLYFDTLIESGDTAIAVEHIRHLIESLPDNVEPMLLAIRFFNCIGDSSSAQATFADLFDTTFDTAGLFTSRISTDFIKASKLNMSVSKGIVDKEKVDIIRQALILFESFEEALSIKDKSLRNSRSYKMKPVSRSITQLKKGIEYCLSEQYDNAITYLQRAAKSGALYKAGLGSIYLLIGFTHYKTGNHAKAVDAYIEFFRDGASVTNRSLELHLANFLDACLSEGVKAYVAGNHLDADFYLSTALKTSPDLGPKLILKDVDPESVITLTDIVETSLPVLKVLTKTT